MEEVLLGKNQVGFNGAITDHLSGVLIYFLPACVESLPKFVDSNMQVVFLLDH